MKRIYQGHDIAFNLTLNYFPIDIAHVDNIEFTFYTTNSKDGIKKNKSNVSDGSLIIQWFELAKLAEGVLYYDYKVNNNALDTVTNVMTDFYIMSGVKDINIETKEVDWGNIKGTITNQADLTDYVKHKVETGDSKKVDKVSGKSLIEDSEIARLKTLKNYDDSTVKADIKKLESSKLDKSEAQTKYQPKGNYLTEHQKLDHKVDKVDGKSLVLDKEIIRLSKVTNYDDKKVKSDIEYLKSNKANQSYVDSEIGLLATKDELSNKADVSIIPQRLSQLDNDVNYVQDGAYVHTDNNFGNADKDKLDQLHNYNDTEVKDSIKSLDTKKQDKAIYEAKIKELEDRIKWFYEYGEGLPKPIAIYDAKGRNNDELPETINKLPNLAPNGNHDYDITLNNFNFDAFGNYGGYGTNFEKWLKGSKPIFIIDKHILTITKGYKENNVYYACIYLYLEKNDEVNIKVNIQGLSQDTPLYFGKNSEIPLKNGLNYITYKSNVSATVYAGFRTAFNGECNITIELLPQYPDGLYFDGVDDFGLCEKFPIFTKEKGYTIIAKRLLNESPNDFLLSNYKDSKNQGAFKFERNRSQDSHNIQYGNYGYVASIPYDVFKNNISFQTSQYYNEIKIKKGNELGTNALILGGETINYGRWKGVFYELHIFDRDLPPELIESYIKTKIDSNYTLPKA